MYNRSFFYAAAAVSALLLSSVPTASAVEPAVTVHEVAQTADLIFSGTVAGTESITSGTAVFTEVRLNNVNRISSTPESRQAQEDEINILIAGGQLNHGFLRVSGTPSFEPGKKYLLFVLDDGRPYVSPLVGGSQGLFSIIQDPATGKEVLVNQSGRALTGVDSSGMPAFTAKPVLAGSSTRMSDDADRYVPVDAVSTDGRIAPASQTGNDARSDNPMTVGEFISYIQNVGFTRQVTAPTLKLKDKTPGKFYKMNNGQLEAEDLLTTGASLLKPAFDTNGQPNTEMTAVPEVAPRGQELGACGAYDGYITMERVPTDNLSYWVNEDCMAHYNDYMDVFRVRNSDGTIGGGNGQSEFGGFVSDQTIQDLYGYNWGSSVGLCFTYSETSSACSDIIESDVYYNPAYSYSDDPYVWLNNTGVYNLRAVAVHEIGHTWGYQLGVAEAYDYDRPSVMHGMYQTIYETGRGLHATDAYIFRRHYDHQTSIRSITDVGIESYYASGGLNKATTNGTIFARGNAITFSNVTSENMGRSTANVRVRFYLSTSHAVTASSYQVGGDWTFGTTGLAAESFSRNNFGPNVVPSNVPTGTYYVLAQIDIPGITDNYQANNTAVFSERVSITAPTIYRTPSLLSRAISSGHSASSQSFTIANSGSGTLSYSMGVTYNSASTGWVSLNTYSGTSSGETDTITVSYNTVSLPAGYHSATINITDPNATNSGQTVLVSMDVAAPPAPANDNFGNASTLSGLTGSVSGTNTNATAETGEPALATNSKSVWWKWTPTQTGAADISTQGSTFDTVLGVYTGSSFPLSLVGSNDDFASPERYSRLSFNATGGSTYRILVTGYSGATGNITLSYDLTAANSSIADWNLY